MHIHLRSWASWREMTFVLKLIPPASLCTLWNNNFCRLAFKVRVKNSSFDVVSLRVRTKIQSKESCCPRRWATTTLWTIEPGFFRFRNVRLSHKSAGMTFRALNIKRSDNNARVERTFRVQLFETVRQLYLTSDF